MEKLQWKVKHKIDFNQDYDFLETILQSCGVEDVDSFLHPVIGDTLDPYGLDNMEKGLKLLHDNLDKQILMKVDSDCDGYFSSAYLTQFIQKLNPDAKIEHRFSFKKEHGLIYEDVAHHKKGELGLIIIPDASILVKELKQIRENLGDVPILILDHHLIEEDNLPMLEDTVTINCMLGDYKDKCLSGVGVVHKFCSAYCDTYDIDQEEADYYLDLVAFGMIADSMNMINKEVRYYTLEGLKPENLHNEFIKELKIRLDDSIFRGELTIANVGWFLCPQINGTIRYGKPEEQIDLFRAICGVQEDREYQPRRKHAGDPKPPVEIHSLQKTMARVCCNVKARQDTEVRNFVKKIDEKIKKDKLDENSVLAIDGSDILTKTTVTGLIANKIASKYKRPTLILKSYKDDRFGGSGRNYGQGKIENLREFLEQFGLFDKLAG